jgi:hypothetical protein
VRSDKYIYSFSVIRGVWEKLSEKEPHNFTGELRLKTDFPVCTGCCFACFICFIIYSYGYMMTSFVLKCSRQAQCNNLCTYYICENIHNLVGPYKTYTSWEAEVSNKKYYTIFQLILKIIIISIFHFFIDP